MCSFCRAGQSRPVAGRWRVLLIAAIALLAGACAGDTDPEAGREGDSTSSEELGTIDDPSGEMGGDEMMGMEGMPDDVPQLPPVFGYFDGERVLFVHPEASDEDVAELLTGMMGSPVLTVPGLADVADDALADLYAFTNGVRPDGTPAGPFGFQPDVFDSIPGDHDYSPLRRLVTVSWQDEDAARLLASTEEIDQAVEDGEVTLERTATVINAPMLSWPGGQR